ncbi:MAG TPA: glycosyltransferase family 2 protein [Phycisphaerae bacterium]|nr:glycosyltransferase family 2 protein [Phycisphaerae bacterium]
MIVFVALLGLYALCGLLYWLWNAFTMYRMGRSVAYLGEAAAPDPPRRPTLSVVVAACDEADRIEPAALSLLGQDYPGLEIVLVDDRSTDATGQIIDRLAAADPRVAPVHVTELPAGWLGKVHVLREGLSRCRGELVLFTDADVHFEPGALATAVAYFRHRGLDHLAALPRLWPSRLVLDAVLGLSIRQLLIGARPWAVPDANSRAVMGVGAFNLVRREAFERAGGFEWLRLEVADDFGLGLAMKRSGARCEVVNAFSLMGLHWYRTLGEAARGAEKAWATVSNFRLRRTLAVALLTFFLELSPFLALLPLAFGPVRWVGLAGLGVFAAYVAAAGLMWRWSRGRLLPPLLGPLTVPIAAYALLRAAVLGRRRGGVMWRGTVYPDDALREGKRVYFP